MGAADTWFALGVGSGPGNDLARRLPAADRTLDGTVRDTSRTTDLTEGE